MVNSIDNANMLAGKIVDAIPVRGLGLLTVASVCFAISTVCLLAFAHNLARAQDGIRSGRLGAVPLTA